MHFHIEDVGRGRVLLFIHAGVADSRMWRGQIGLGGYRTIAFDKRGFGGTPWQPGPFSDTEDAITVLDKLNVSTAVIVGCSMGAATALDLAIENPDRVEALVLVGAYPSGWVPEGGWEDNPLEEAAIQAAEAGDFDRVIDLDLQMWLIGYGRSEEDVPEDLKDLFRNMNRSPVTTAAEREQHQTGFERRINEQLDAVACPTLVIVGAHDEGLLIDAAAYLADRLSNVPAIVIENAAHLPSLERPVEFNELLEGFLASI